MLVKLDHFPQVLVKKKIFELPPTLPTTNIAPENGWLEDKISIGILPIFRGYVSLREGRTFVSPKARIRDVWPSSSSISACSQGPAWQEVVEVVDLKNGWPTDIVPMSYDKCWLVGIHV